MRMPCCIVERLGRLPRPTPCALDLGDGYGALIDPDRGQGNIPWLQRRRPRVVDGWRAAGTHTASEVADDGRAAVGLSALLVGRSSRDVIPASTAMPAAKTQRC